MGEDLTRSATLISPSPPPFCDVPGRRVQTSSLAHVELFQSYPDGQPRDVIITGNAVSVELAVCMVNEVRVSSAL